MFPNKPKPNSLNGQIRDAERRWARCRQGVDNSGSRLFKHLGRRITAPDSLLLAGGVGFLFGEFSKRQTVHACRQQDDSTIAETTAWSITLNFISVLDKLYTALPLILIVKSWMDQGMPNTESGQRQESASDQLVANLPDYARQATPDS